MLTPTPTTPNFNCNSPPFLIKIKRRAKKVLSSPRWEEGGGGWVTLFSGVQCDKSVHLCTQLTNMYNFCVISYNTLYDKLIYILFDDLEGWIYMSMSRSIIKLTLFYGCIYFSTMQYITDMVKSSPLLKLVCNWKNIFWYYLICINKKWSAMLMKLKSQYCCLLPLIVLSKIL